jgi:outer membrane protein TolC
VGVSIDVPIETAGKRGYRVARAQRLTEAARLELGETAWQVRRRVRQAFADHAFAALERDALNAEARARAELGAITERRLALGDATSGEVETARAELAAARLARQAAEGRAIESRGALAAALGLPVAALDGLALAWPEATRLPDAEVLTPPAIQRAGLVNRLDVRRSLAEYAAAEAALQLEIARQYPDIHLGPGYKFDQGDNKFSLGLGVTLPVFDRNQGPIAEAEARRRELQARFLALQAAVIGSIEAAGARYRAVLPEVREADAALAALEARERATERAVAAGEEDRPALVAVRIQRASAARARLDTLRKAHAALGALEDALQQPLPPGPAVPELPTTSRSGGG